MSLAARDWKGLLLGLLEATLLVTAAFSIATTFDEWHRLLELFSHFRLQYFVASAVLTVVFIALRWTGYVAIGLATCTLNAWFIVPWYLPVDGAGGTGPEITVLHANVLKSNGNAERFVRFVDELDPDFVVMQEVTPAWLESVRVLEKHYPHRITEEREGPFGIALFSKIPLEASAVLEDGPLGTPAIVATAKLGDRPLHLVATHPVPPIGGGNYGARNLQLDSAARLLARLPSPKMLIGDLNITMWANHYRKLERDSGLRNARRGFGIRPTWPVFFPPGAIPIDHILVSADIDVLAFDTGPIVGSDHLPVVARLRVGD